MQLTEAWGKSERKDGCNIVEEHDDLREIPSRHKDSRSGRSQSRGSQYSQYSFAGLCASWRYKVPTSHRGDPNPFPLRQGSSHLLQSTAHASEENDEEMRFIGAPLACYCSFAYHHGCWKLERFDDSVSSGGRRLVRKAREVALCVSGADHCAQQKRNRNHHFQSHDGSEAQQRRLPGWTRYDHTKLETRLGRP